MKTSSKALHLLLLLYLLPSWSEAQHSNAIARGIKEAALNGRMVNLGVDSLVPNDDSIQTAHLLEKYLANVFQPDSLPDYLSHTGKSLLQNQKDQAFNTGHALLKKVMADNSILEVRDMQRYLDRLSPKRITSGFSDELREKPFSYTGINVTDEGQVVPAYFGRSYNVVNSLSISGQVSIKNIPIALRFTRQDMSGSPFVSRTIFSSSFDKDAFLAGMKKRLKQSISPSDIFPDDHILGLMHQGVENILKRQIDSIVSDGRQASARYLKGFSDPDKLLDRDISQLSEQMFSDKYRQFIASRKNILLQLQQKVNSGQAVDKQLMDSLTAQVTEFKKLQAIYQKILSAKQKWEKDPVVQKLQQIKSLKEKKFETLLNNPATMKQMAAKYLPLQGMEKFFMNINSLNLGEHTSNLSPLSLQNFSSAGASIEMEKKNKYLMLIAGKERGLNGLFDKANFSSLFPQDHRVVGISMGKGDPQADHTHITLMSYKQENSSQLNNSSPVAGSSTVVAGIDNQFSIGDNTNINIELSKSAMRYDNAAPEAGKSSSMLAKLAHLNNGGNGVAAMVRMRGNYSKIGLNVQSSLSLIANSYYDPGNIYLPRGTKKISFSGQKYFFKRRLSLDGRADVQRYRFAMDKDRQLQNNFFSLQARWNIKNGEFIALSYQPSSNFSMDDKVKNVAGVTDRLQVTGNIHHQFFGTFYQNIYSIAYSHNKYNWGDAGEVDNRSMTYTMMQSIVLAANLLYLNTTYDHADNMSAIVYFNTTFTSELGYTYRIGKKINGSSAVEYDAVDMWYRQAGIRQSLSVDVNSKLQMSLFVDVKSNIKLYNASYYNDLYQGNWSLHYSF